MTTSTTTNKKTSKIKRIVMKENRRIRGKNARFEALSPSEKRVAIAQDVLLQIESGKLIPETGNYLIGDGEWGCLLSNVKPNTDVRTAISKIETCTGCALGGMFMCAVDRANKIKVKDFINTDYKLSDTNDIEVDRKDLSKYLGRFFSNDQLDCIENAFEACEMFKSSDDAVIAAEWALDVFEPSDRMRLIMENIILHKGKFNPELEPIGDLDSNRWITPGYLYKKVK